ncbi:hypothetical protein CDAR_409741 [Caerostris darwini]|uniref:Uncharacterized protein n=1 Tax=Caerostris darwini TaxID=1538125 RepID=A0AAV4VKG1_9ARAC|nr:hypothetical protein CDAR_409741 [Caerostris darwini]
MVPYLPFVIMKAYGIRLNLQIKRTLNCFFHYVRVTLICRYTLLESLLDTRSRDHLLPQPHFAKDIMLNNSTPLSADDIVSCRTSKKAFLSTREPLSGAE